MVVSLEQEVKGFLHVRRINFRDGSSSYKDLDFVILSKDRPYFYLEVKEKQKPYSVMNWPRFVEERWLFIVDDLTVRKCLARSPRSGVLVRDNKHGEYYFFSVIDLALMPRLRVNRPIKKEVQAYKGKWLIDLRNGRQSKDIEGAFSSIREYLEELDGVLFETLECYGSYVDEEISSGGITRVPKYWKHDVETTR
ncbi:hypothetical protein D6779_11660 [Candidatus Parcubacteria bacterium]|nr:MAG: hypothetical protein D6779_11660 [Candidatus Parcubacteria bacterium]